MRDQNSSARCVATALDLSCEPWASVERKVKQPVLLQRSGTQPSEASRVVINPRSVAVQTKEERWDSSRSISSLATRRARR
jgi:DNA polymerase IIIc chi subunit